MMTRDLPVGTYFIWTLDPHDAGADDLNDLNITVYQTTPYGLRIVQEEHRDFGNESYVGDWHLRPTHRIVQPCRCPKHEGAYFHLDRYRREVINGQVR